VSWENYLSTRTSISPYIDVLRPLEDKRKYDSPLRHLGVAAIYHRGCIYHPSRGYIYHRGGDFAIAVAMIPAIVGPFIDGSSICRSTPFPLAYND
jgi:hypothetical protein